MSIKVMSRVWSESNQRGGTLIVLLAIADFANDEGMAFPSIPTLATKSRLSESQVHRTLRKLRDQHELTIQYNAGPHETNVYWIQFPEGVAGAGGALCEGSTHATPRGFILAPGGSAHATRGVAPMRPKPSREPSLEPSGEPSIDPAFDSGFEAMRTIPAYRPDPGRDGKLVRWLAERRITEDVFLRSATALAANWPPRKSKNPDPWLQVRTYCLNQKKWDSERGRTNGHVTGDAARNPFEVEAEQERERLAAGDERRRAAGLSPLPRPGVGEPQRAV